MGCANVLNLYIYVVHFRDTVQEGMFSTFFLGVGTVEKHTHQRAKGRGEETPWYRHVFYAFPVKHGLSYVL